MKLAEAEVVGPPEHEGDSEVITPPRPPHRRVSISLIFTLTVLIGTVVTIYKVFPARQNVLLDQAISHYQGAAPTWELANPTLPALDTWVDGIVGQDVKLFTSLAPAPTVIGARRIEILDRDAALIRLEIGGEPVTVIVQQTRTILPDRAEQTEGAVHAVASRHGSYMIVAAGPAASQVRWLPVTN